MYGKIFDSMYTGTLYGQWRAIVTFQQLIVLADADGMVDMTPPAISAVTSIPLEIIEEGLKVLSSDDPYSRTPGAEGRRIELIDAHRPWGWHIVNHAKYKGLQDADTVRAQTRERMRRHRERRGDGNALSRPVMVGNEQSRTVTDGDGQKRYTDTDTDTDTKVKPIVGRNSAPDAARKADKQLRAKQAVEILTFLNDKAGKHYQPVKQNVDLIVGLLNAGATPDDIRAVVAKKVREWKGKPEMEQYLRPATLFGPKNFHSKYAGEIPPESTEAP
jgi:uncharacterized phage protein (TIGR02220 family)